MPKEYVKGINQQPYDDNWRVEVGWDKHYPDVRIATTDPEADMGTRESGLWVNLDRDSINQLIRLLRKARDGAFGKDE